MSTFIVSDPQHTEEHTSVMLNVDHIRQIEITSAGPTSDPWFTVRAITTYGSGIDLFSASEKADVQKVYDALGDRIARAQGRGETVVMAELIAKAIVPPVQTESSPWFAVLAEAITGIDEDYSEDLGEFGGWVNVRESEMIPDALNVTLTLKSDEDDSDRVETSYVATLVRV